MIDTWENAAADVGREIRDMEIGGYPDPLEAVEAFIDNTYGNPTVDPRASFMLIADEALSVYSYTMNMTRAQALDIVLATIAEKQADYGPQNILWAGTQGILLRMHDKTARIKNLARREVPGNESLADSWLDLVGYAIVGVMLIDGTFERPLARDLAVEAVPDPFAQLAEDPNIKDALRQFVANASKPEYVEREGDDEYNINGGGAIQVYPAPDGSHTHVVIQDGEGNVVDIMATAGYITIDTDGTAFTCNTQRMSVLLCMLLGASEASLAWRNTNMTAEVPREQ